MTTYRFSFVKVIWERGYLLTEQGPTKYATMAYTLDYIAVEPGFEIKISHAMPTACVWYNEDKKAVGSRVIENAEELGNPVTVIVPAKARYMRVNMGIEIVNTQHAAVYQEPLDNVNLVEAHPVRPIYKSDLSVEISRETPQWFYRKSLSGKLTFAGEDFKYIITAPFERIFRLLIEESSDFGQSWENIFTGKFAHTDCSVNLDDQFVEVQPEIEDQYTEILAGYEREYNLIDLAKIDEPLVIARRPIIQIYVSWSDTVDCLIPGGNWRQNVTDVAGTIESQCELIEKFHFSASACLRTVFISFGTIHEAGGVLSGTFAGKMQRKENEDGEEVLEGDFTTLSASQPWGNRFVLRMTQWMNDKKEPFKGLSFQAVEKSTGKVFASEFLNDWSTFDGENRTWVSGTGSRKQIQIMQNSYIYGRIVLNTDEFEGISTFPLSEEDICTDNKNYRKAIGFIIDGSALSTEISEKPNAYGVAYKDSTSGDIVYFAPPYSLGSQSFMPIGQDTWGYGVANRGSDKTFSSIWYLMNVEFGFREKHAWDMYLLRDSYSLPSCISGLLSKVAPSIHHEASSEYSQFLYASGTSNVVYGKVFRVFLTPKTNLMNSRYTSSAQKAVITLQQILNMLRDVFACYWFIEDNKLRIEHLSFFQHGGRYDGEPITGIDLTKVINIRNNKPWAFTCSSYSYNKSDMPKQYIYKWADDVSEGFEGRPIEIESNYAQDGKIEEVNVSGFTSDVDTMLLDPESMNPDGFALFATEQADAIATSKIGIWDDYVETSGSSGMTSPAIKIWTVLGGQEAVLCCSATGNGTGILKFYDKSGALISESYGTVYTGTSQLQELKVIIPRNATSFAFQASGVLNVRVYNLKALVVNQLIFSEIGTSKGPAILQNGLLSFAYLQPAFLRYGMPAWHLRINGQSTLAASISKNKQQVIKYPGNIHFNPTHRVKTFLGNGEVEKISINLSSGAASATLNYDTTAE